MQRWDAYDEWLTNLRRLDYHTSELKLNAEDFGVPQSRRRLFVVADREREPLLPIARANKTVTVKDILYRGQTVNGYNYNMRPLFGAGRAKPTLERADRAIKAIGANEPFLIVYYGSDAAGGWQTLDRPLRTITTLDRFALVEPNGNGHRMRMLQPPELAAAMGFPKDYHWPKSTRREHIKLIGNAVSPPVMRAIVEALTS
jgi:DNA (cytosine-5)-methyltransferase 1